MKDITGEETLESMTQAVWYNQWTMKKFLPFLKGEILEVGCGIGNFTKALAEYGQVWAIDIDNTYLNQTKELVGSKIKVGFGDIEKGKYFFNNKLFDTIICLNVLEHIQNDKSALKNLYKLLKYGGHLILLVPSHAALFGTIDKSIGHFRRYEKQNIASDLKKIGFETIYSRRLNFLGGIGWWISGNILKENTVTACKIKSFNLLAPIILPIEDIIEPPFGTSILLIARRR